MNCKLPRVQSWVRLVVSISVWIMIGEAIGNLCSFWMSGRLKLKTPLGFYWQILSLVSSHQHQWKHGIEFWTDKRTDVQRSCEIIIFSSENKKSLIRKWTLSIFFWTLVLSKLFLFPLVNFLNCFKISCSFSIKWAC